MKTRLKPIILLLVIIVVISAFAIFTLKSGNSTISSKSYAGDYPSNSGFKNYMIYRMNLTQPPSVFKTSVIAAVRHNALDTRTKYFNLNSYDSIDDCIEVFAVFTNREGTKCFLGYKFETQYYLLEISGNEERFICQKLLDEDFYKLSNLMSREELDDRRYGYYFPSIKNTPKDYSLIDYISVFEINVGAINNGSVKDNMMIENFFNYLKNSYLLKIKKDENKVDNWEPRLQPGSYLE